MVHVDSDGYEVLALAIVQNAVEEYKDLYSKSIKTTSEVTRAHAKNSMKALERFFKSQWCFELCGLDGEKIISGLKSNGGI